MTRPKEKNLFDFIFIYFFFLIFFFTSESAEAAGSVVPAPSSHLGRQAPVACAHSLRR
jgi:hypothetical protein